MISISQLRHRHFVALLVLAVSVLVSSPQSSSQTAAEAAKIAAKLSPASQKVVERLSGLRELPDQTWKMHSGDLAHGEAVGLNESDWQVILSGSQAPNDAVWFRQTYTVPQSLDGYDLTGARIWFQFHAYANGPMPQIIYFNGRRVALGDDLEPIVLLDQAKPGEKVVVVVKLLHTVDKKNFRGATLKIDFTENRPNPEDLREEFLSGSLLVPSLAPDDPTQMALLNSAIEAVDLKALDAHDQAKFDASLKTSHQKLEALLPLMQKAAYHLTGNSHIDAAWLWPWTETVDVVKRTFSTALQLMYEYPGYTYTQSAAAYNEWLADKYPEMNAEIAQRIKEGRWEIVGGMWVEPDLNMPDGESLVRQLLVGKRWYKQHYGIDVRIGWNPDSFGYTWQLPQIYKKNGIDYFVTQKMAWNDTNQMPFKFFWWESPDGSKVLAYFPHDYANDNLNAVRLARDLTAARTHIVGQTDMLDLYGVGDHGGGPTRAILDEGMHWATPSTPPHVLPKIEFGTAQSYFTDIEKQIAPESPEWNYTSIAKGFNPPAAVSGKVSIPTWKDELYFEYHRGVMTTQANHKRNMRESEVEVLNTEKWASLAWLDGNSYPASELTEDWKKVLFNQFHDLAAGSGIGIIYKEAQKDYDVVRWSTNEINTTALNALSTKIGTPDAATGVIPIIVWNPLGWTRTSNVTVKVPVSNDVDMATWNYHADDRGPHATRLLAKDSASGTATFALSDVIVPALGYSVLYLTPRKSTPPQHHSRGESADTYTLENSEIRVVINKTTGCITSLEDKSHYNLIASGKCGNQLLFFKDTPKDYDAWNIDPGTLDQPPATIAKADSVDPIWSNDALAAVRVAYHWQSSKFVQTISLPVNYRSVSDDAGQVNIDNEIDWHETHILLKAAFPLSVSSPFATYDIPYGTIERPTTRNNSWEIAKFEVPAMRWADLGDGQHGLSVINDTKYGYDAVGSTLRLSLLRSPVWPDPEADRGHHHFQYSLYPHKGTWKDALTVRHGYNYCYPLMATVATGDVGAATQHTGTEANTHSFASVSPENVVLTAMKKAEDANGLIFRVYEWAGKDSTVEFHVPTGATAATVTNMQEVPQGGPLQLNTDKDGSVIKAPIHPYEILTIRVEYPNGGPKQ